MTKRNDIQSESLADIAIDPDILAKVSEDLGEAMVGINISSLPKEDRLENRGV